MADLGGVYVRWVWSRAVLHRGWWLVASVYLVVDARLPASELVLIGVGQAVVALVFEVPAGVVADSVSRKWSLVVSHVLMGVAMLATGLVDGFAALLVTQMLWGLAWTFASGSDVAWVSDELDDPAYTRMVLIRAEQAQLLGTVAGLLGLGGLAWLVGRGPALVLAGAAMVVLGLYVVVGFQERRFVPAARTRQWSTLRNVLRNRALPAVFAATFLVQGAADAFGRLYPLRLLDAAPDVDPILWFTGLGVLMSLAGAAALRLVQKRLDERRGFVVACAVAATGVIGLAFTPVAAGVVAGSLAVVAAAGALQLTRVFATVWVNTETVSAVRATVHSLLAQAEYTGKIACGLAIALVADHAGVTLALAAGGLLILAAIATLRGTGSPSRAAG